MDFRSDKATWDLGDQFMFGPSLMVSPVLKEHATERSVYLPSGATWYDFWTGKQTVGGREVEVAAPLETIPLNVRAGSIVPLGPAIEYAGQASDPIELRVYPGADGNFTLYEDEGDSYRYTNGAYATIAMHWNDATRTLTLSKRAGRFNGMTAKHLFNVVVVAAGHGVGGVVTPTPDKAVAYTGDTVEVKF
jgi:alpha-D-xyloside xylohydrolase